ncbi:hypothetical protein OCU04_003627 [Sclerotinia nivalis]|uniref:Secreted protein n=1 Tax=Sclerotinia nivalis TaxID=352851 RepID=A0A9X0ASQ6_9HELO|nr:hypothetical protein OCU04_003627 [Sclerotinia nivalis]
MGSNGFLLLGLYFHIFQVQISCVKGKPKIPNMHQAPHITTPLQSSKTRYPADAKSTLQPTPLKHLTFFTMLEVFIFCTPYGASISRLTGRKVNEVEVHASRVNL